MRHLRQNLETRASQLEAAAISSSIPIWRPLTSRELSKALGISVQVLANWRVRDQGPPSRPAPRGKGNRRLYRMDEVLAWLTGRPAWVFARSWLATRGLAPGDCGEEDVDWVVNIIA
ncbi:helix-turn-helix domain-containing protein [Leisingera sp. D0M16]|uniref:helix-turn-helix domain-containing protein n=1 Tax=Leisingera coralii TaxID=3351347 RepID=UPI003B7901F7